MGATGSISSAYSSPSSSEREVRGKSIQSSNLQNVVTNMKSTTRQVDLSPSTKILRLEAAGGIMYELEFCYLSRRGFYPSEDQKPNQDSFLICENFMGDCQTHIFSIFDGHGETGDLCSYFTAEKLLHFLETAVKSRCVIPISLFFTYILHLILLQFTSLYDCSSVGSPVAFESYEMNKVYTQAFENMNKSLHLSSIDDTLSGTTAITITLRGNILYGIGINK
jgi:serine/threonine protein phosphatase PrpC